jgi:hypothetical protein
MSRAPVNVRAVFIALVVFVLVVALLPGGAGAQEGPGDQREDPDAVSLVSLSMPDRATLDDVVSRGYDLDHNVARAGGRITVSAVVTGPQIAELEDMGVQVEIEVDEAEAEARRRGMLAERQETLDAAAALADELNLAAIDTVVIARADYFTSTGDSEFLSVEAKSTDGAAADLTVAWDAGPGTEIGDGGSAELDDFVDAGQYLYHREQIELSGRAALVIEDGPAAGSYEAVGASFGPSLDVTGTTGTVELADDGSGDPTEACDPLVGFTAGNIALIDRGSCAFTQKVSNAQAAGAVAVVVANNTGSAPFAMGGSDSSITIPSAMISRDDGDTIKSGLPATGTLAQLETQPPPTRVRVTSSNGGSAEAEVTEWLETNYQAPNNPYFQGFLDHYPDAYELTGIIEQLAADFPDLAEVIDLPYETNGYRRKAMHLSGGGSSQRVGLTSHAWGHEGGNDLTVAYVDPGAANSALSVDVDGDDIVVTLATDGGGGVVSTAAEVVAAINTDAAASALVEAYTYRGNSGGGTVEAADAESLWDGLEAPEHVERAPFQPKMLRIGKHRDGSKTGVLTYSQEHAREWQTPLVNIETAYRLLHNYRTDGKTRQIVDNLDIFIVPTVNPDGALYSFYDAAFQRKNMTRYCEVGEPNDFNARNAWGVDNNRNYTVGSLFDGYDGASTSCTSTVFAGPEELSEPESRNVHWIPDEYDNIRFAMNIHSSGNYFMWSPGAYKLPGRITLPRPSFGTEEYFFDASSDILTEIKQWRGLSVTPARTGPIADVLYSAAGNSGDMLYYEYDLYAWNFEVGTSFQPEWEEAFNQMMEFSNGVIELYDVAREWTDDRQPPRSWINQPGNGTYDGPVGITFGYSEAADVYYTLDGSKPTTASPVYGSAGIREGGETITIDETTTIRWFAVDARGNEEPANNQRTIVIND